MTLKLLFAGTDISSFQPIKSAFEREDVFTITATSIGLALFLARKNQPHLIICEQHFVDGDAISFFYEMRNEAELSKIPFAFFLKNQQAKTEVLNALGHDIENSVHFLVQENEFAQQETLPDWKSKILRIIDFKAGG